MVNKKLLALLAVVVLAVAACGSSKDSDEAATDTTQSVRSSSDADTTDDTEEEAEEETDATDGLKPRINLGGLESGTDTPFTEDETACMEEAIGEDPAFADMESYEDITAQADREAFWNYVLDCTGPEPLVALFMEGFADGAGPEVTSEQLACVEDLVSSLSAEEGVALLSGDPTVTESLTTDVAFECLS